MRALSTTKTDWTESRIVCNMSSQNAWTKLQHIDDSECISCNKTSLIQKSKHHTLKWWMKMCVWMRLIFTISLANVTNIIYIERGEIESYVTELNGIKFDKCRLMWLVQGIETINWNKLSDFTDISKFSTVKRIFISKNHIQAS